MITVITALFGDLIPYILAAVAALAGLWGWGKVKKREGAQAERAREAARDAAADQQAHERMNNADLGLDATDDERRQRLRDFAAKHGPRPPKAGR